MRSAVVAIAVMLLGAGCSNTSSVASPTEVTVTTLLVGAEVTLPSRPGDVRPLVAACLAEAASVGATSNFSEGCDEAAIAAEAIGLDSIASDLREMMTTTDPSARLDIINQLQLAIANL